MFILPCVAFILFSFCLVPFVLSQVNTPKMSTCPVTCVCRFITMTATVTLRNEDPNLNDVQSLLLVSVLPVQVG